MRGQFGGSLRHGLNKEQLYKLLGNLKFAFRRTFKIQRDGRRKKGHLNNNPLVVRNKWDKVGGLAYESRKPTPPLGSSVRIMTVKTHGMPSFNRRAGVTRDTLREFSSRLLQPTASCQTQISKLSTGTWKHAIDLPIA